MITKKKMIRKEDLTIVSTYTTVGEVLNLMRENGFLSIPVVDNGKFMGVIQKAELFSILFNMECEKEESMTYTIENFYTQITQGVQEDAILEDAADMLLKNKISFVPVFYGEDFVGIITHTAIFKAYSEALGVGTGTRLSVTSYHTPGRLAILSSIVSDLGGNIVAIAMDDTKVMGIARTILRVDGCDIKELTKQIEASGFKVEK